MGEVRHSRQTVSDGIHIPYAYEYANAAARTGASGFSADDVGKLARQTDNNSLWMLTATTPTWLEVNTGIGGSGETNTASNVGTAGVGVFKQKTGVDLEFKKINAASAKVTVTDDTGNDEVDIDVVTGTSANSVCVGNDSRLSDDRNDPDAIHDDVSGEIAAVTEKATPVSADLLLIEDSAASNAKKRVQIGNLPPPVFGSEYDFAEKITSQSTTSNSFQQYLRLSTDSLLGGTYRIAWMYVWRYSSVASDFKARVQVDSTNLINPDDGSYPFQQQEPKDAGSDQRYVSAGFRHISLGAGSHDIDLDFCTGGADTAYMYHGQIEIWRVT